MTDAAAAAVTTHRRAPRRWTFGTGGVGRVPAGNDDASGPNAASMAAAVGRLAGSFSNAAAMVRTSVDGRASPALDAGSGAAETMAWSVPNNEFPRNGCFPYAIS